MCGEFDLDQRPAIPATPNRANILRAFLIGTPIGLKTDLTHSQQTRKYFLIGTIRSTFTSAPQPTHHSPRTNTSLLSLLPTDPGAPFAEDPKRLAHRRLSSLTMRHALINEPHDKRNYTQQNNCENNRERPENPRPCFSCSDPLYGVAQRETGSDRAERCKPEGGHKSVQLCRSLASMPQTINSREQHRQDVNNRNEIRNPQADSAQHKFNPQIVLSPACGWPADRHVSTLPSQLCEPRNAVNALKTAARNAAIPHTRISSCTHRAMSSE